MKQTAVEWLIEEYINGAVINIQIMKKALEMENEQMEKTFKQAQECAIKSDGVYFKYESFEQYYNETYKR